MPGKITAKYDVQKKYLVIYLCAFIGSGLLFLLRALDLLAPGLSPLPSFLLLHVTNFSLSLMVLSSFGFAALIFGGGIKTITAAGLSIAAINIAYELLFPILGTPDFPDAASGLIGAAAAYVFLLLLRKNGLTSKRKS